MLSGGNLLDLGIRMGPRGLGKEFLQWVDPLQGDLFVATAGDNSENRQREDGDKKTETLHIK
jgi:hypothetical protein